MRLLHTSDWHLGRSFHQVGLLDAQGQFLDHLVEVVRAEGVDAVLVAGDVYDRAQPAPDTVALLSDALERLIDAGAQVILSSGNHDSATRLGFGSRLLERAGLHIRTSVADIGRPVLVGDVAVHPIPYLEPAVVADALGASERTHAGVLRAATARIREAQRAAPSRHTVVMAHTFVIGGAGSDSERDITQGGVSAVPASVVQGFSFAALGHLHRRQRIAEGIHYSGSPVAMSFSEAGHVKGTLLVDLSGESARVETVPAPVGTPLAVLRGELADLLADPALTAAEQSWCQVTLTDPTRPLGAMEALRRRFPGTLELRFEPVGAITSVVAYAARVASRGELDVCCDFLPHVRGGEPASDAERELLREALERARVARGVAEDEGLARLASTGGAGAA